MEKTDRDYKKEYEIIQKKNGLPEFQRLVEDFDVEKFLEKESAILIRDIRRAMVEKFVAYSHFFENLINPSSQSMLLFSVIKRLNEKDKEKIKEIFKTLIKIQIKAMKVDVVYSEKLEVKFIKEAFDEWQVLKVKVKEVVDNFDENQNGVEGSIDRGYFG